VYNFIFDTKINFGQKNNELVFHTNYLAEPISQDQQSLDKFLENPVFNLMSILWRDTSLRSRIQDIIKVDLSKELPSIEEVADELNYSTATLRRRLRDEGTTYKKIKDDLRRDYAIYELEHGCCIERVAENTGFSDPSSFYRSFKRWTGTTPRSYVKSDETGL
jgi:AraC-like DNA-binding protein